MVLPCTYPEDSSIFIASNLTVPNYLWFTLLTSLVMLWKLITYWNSGKCLGNLSCIRQASSPVGYLFTLNLTINIPCLNGPYGSD